ncbi:keratin, type I cytoskeletal 10-like [Impatiens glandulifera]|uniref:keratin, type I cytoskeletal 10-like n=1 Tax=Impatiens glandulifera TaxID=253017 RepID=UPI001FB14845|nr:keratin, type I cytoskeletal 10-like [Impatiens glandulifera]
MEEKELEEEDQNKSDGESGEDEPEQSIQVHTNFSPIQTMAAYSQNNSSNEGSSADGIKLMKSMSTTMLQNNVAVMQSNMSKFMEAQKEDKKNFDDLVNTHKELELTLKKNTYEVEDSNTNFGRFEKKLFNRQSEMMSLERQINLDNQREVMEAMGLIQNQLDKIQGIMRRTYAERLEYADSIARKFQAEENAKDDAKKEQNTITQGNDVRDRRGDSVTTGTRSKRMPTNDENPRPTKRGGGQSGGDHGNRRSGDRGGRSSGGDRGGRSSGGDRGGRSTGSDRGVELAEVVVVDAVFLRSRTC